MNKKLMLEKYEALELRRMSSDHLEQIMAIERLAYPFPWTKSMFATSLSSGDLCLILVLNEEIVGYAIVNYILDEAHLLNICISPQFEKRGLGRVLLRYLISEAKEKACMMFFLEVRQSNVQAISLYFSEGFNEVGVRPNYYPAQRGREDAVLMTLDLSVDLYA